MLIAPIPNTEYPGHSQQLIRKSHCRYDSVTGMPTRPTDLNNVRNRVVGILFGLIVTAVVFRYIWPERADGGIKKGS